MRITKVSIHNYRTLENISIAMPCYYTALCGKNDAGKSNVIRVLRSAFQLPGQVIFAPDPAISVKDDFTKWKMKSSSSDDRYIQVDYSLQIAKDDDEGIYRFIQEYLKLTEEILVQPEIELNLSIRRTLQENTAGIGISIGGQSYEALKSQEVFNKIQSSSSVLFHDSTEFFHPYRFRESAGLFSELSPAEADKVKAAKANLDRALTKVAKRNQQDMSEVLGRLKDKYRVGLSILNSDATDVPYTITLGNEDGDVELEQWGSGTQNRTRILMTLFKAKRVRDAIASAAKVTPIIIIEEPESYLHPSAQAEFGKTLRDLAEEFKVQVIVTTHSPYLLSLDEPHANVLLERKVIRKRARQTEITDTSGDKWAEPFSLALGVSGSELAPWKDAIFTVKTSILLVEGAIDKEYLTLLQDPAHGENRLKFDGGIFAYDGKDTLKQKQMLKFMKSHYDKFIVTFDLDCELEIERHLQDIGMTKGIDYLTIGKDIPGKKAIEGLLPESVLQTVFAANVELVQKATSGTTAEAKSAKASLKKLYLDEFKRTAQPLTEAYKSFYALTKQLNKLFA